MYTRDGVIFNNSPDYLFYFRIMIKSDYCLVAVTMVISQVTNKTVAWAGYLVLGLNLQIYKDKNQVNQLRSKCVPD